MNKSISENKLRKIIRDAIGKTNLAAAVEPSVFESECILKVAIAENITDILTKIRAIESVTVVNIIPGGGKQAGREIESLRIKLKFVKGAFSVRQRMSVILSKINRIEGIIGFKVQRTKKLEQY